MRMRMNWSQETVFEQKDSEKGYQTTNRNVYTNMSQRLTSDELHKRQIMEELKRVCIEGNLIEVHKYMCVVKQPSFPFKEMEKAFKPLVYWAAKTGKVDILKELIETYRCDPHYTTERGHTLLYVACARGHADVVRYLGTRCEVDPNQRNDMQSTPLFAACNNGQLKVILVLVDELKCNPNAINDKGESLLHRACGGGHLEVVKCLITKYNLPPGARNNYMDTPLHDACARGHLLVVQYLIETHRCEINVFNKSLLTPLHVACRSGHSNIVYYLVIEQNCDVAPYDNSGSTPLHLACKFQRKEVVRVLLDSGRVDPNLPTLAGVTPVVMSSDPDIVRYLIRSGAKEYEEEAPLKPLVQMPIIGHSETGKSTLVQALQTPISTYLGGLIVRARTVADDIPRTAGIIPIEFNSPDFGRVLLYDFAGHPEYHASHGAFLEHFNTNTAPLFLLVVDLSEIMSDVKRKLDYWLTFVETHRLSGVIPPRVVIIGSHYDLLKKRTSSKECTSFIASLESHTRNRLKQSKLYLDGFFAIDCRDPKRHRDLRQCLKKSCEGLQVHKRIDSCCYVLSVFLTKEFDKQLACTIEDIIKKVKASVSYPIPMQAERLCDLAEELSTRMKMLFIRNKETPEKSWIVLDIDTLLSKIIGHIFAPETLPEHCLTPTYTGVLPWSQIQRHLPSNLDPSLVVSFLGRLEFCQVIQDPEVLSLIKCGKSDTFSMVDSDEGIGSRQSLCSQMSISSSQSYSSGISSISSHAAGSGVLFEHDGYTQNFGRRESRDGLTDKWWENLYVPNTSPRKFANIVQTEPQMHAASASSYPSTELPQSQAPPSAYLSTHPFTHPLTQPSTHSSAHLSAHPSSTPLQQPGSPPLQQPDNAPQSTSQPHPLASQQHLTRATGGSQPSLSEERARLAVENRLYGSMHRSPSDSCTMSYGQPQHQCNLRARSHDESLRESRHIGCAQSPVINNDKFLFFPGLVNSGQPSGEMWLKDESFVFYSGWCLESGQPHKFFTPRFLQTLILRLAFGFAVSRRPNGVFTSSLSLFSRECTIWKNGLRWLNLDGVETFVEMVEDGRALLLLMRAKKGSELRGVNLRSLLIRKILETKKECCPDMQTSEYLIHPKHLRERESYPIITGGLSHLIRYDISIVAQAIVAENRRRPFRFAIDTLCQNVEPLTTILHFDPYMSLNSETLEKLFDSTNQDQLLSEDLLFDFSRNYPDDADKFQEILLDDSHYTERHTPPDNNHCFEVLRRYWEHTPNLKVSDFRRDLDRHSIFTGRNILGIVYSTPSTSPAQDSFSGEHYTFYDTSNQQKFKVHTSSQTSSSDHSSYEYMYRSVKQSSAPDNIVHVLPQFQSPSTPSITQEQPLLRKQTCDASSSFQRFVNRTFFCHSYKHIVKKYLYCAENIAPVPFLGQVIVLEFDSSGGEYKSNHHGITISIPKGAIPKGETVHVEVAVALYGPFQFSDSKRPISPILWLCPQEDVIFRKPITIILPHMLTDVCNKDVDNFGIQFAKADHTDYRVTPTGKKEYVFKSYTSDVALQANRGKHYAILKADHCCFWCLEMNKQNRVSPKIARQIAKKMGYFIHCVECLKSPYCSISPPRDVIHFCVSFMLDTCMKAIEDQFPPTNVQGELIHKIHTQRFNLNEPHLQLIYSTNDKDLCDVAVSNEGKIYASSVDFWEEGLGQDELKLMHDRKVYPPRVEMTVQLMSHEQRHTKLSINFNGCSSERDSPKFQLFLPLGQNSEAAAAVALSSTIRKNGFKTPKQVYDPEWIQTVPSIPHKGDKPNLRQLQRLCKGCIKVTVLKNIAPKWKELAMEMGFEYSDIEIVDMQTKKDPKNAVYEILGRWLEGTVATDARPLTWSTLVECLSNIECQSLADELSQILLD